MLTKKGKAVATGNIFERYLSFYLSWLALLNSIFGISIELSIKKSNAYDLPTKN